MSKYLPSSLSSFLPDPVVGPDDSFLPEPGLMESLTTVAQTPAPVPKAPPIKFSTDPEALKHNAKLLRDHHYSMDDLISKHQETTLAYGSEFRPIAQLETVLGQHPHFPQLQKILTEGMDFRFARTLTEEERKLNSNKSLPEGITNRPRMNPTPSRGS
jgi:hypothetical protein